MYQIDFQKPIHVHFIGIGGISMSGLAEILLSKRFPVSGSDSKASELTRHLEQLGARVLIGQSAANISDDTELIVYTAAISADNPEFREAKRRELPMLTRAQFLGQLMKNYRTPINIAGTHGKTTTTSMVSEILIHAGCDPTLSVGGILKSIGGNLRIGHSEYFVAEACEYTNSYHSFFPRISLILNIEEDHMDFFKDIHDIRASFRTFMELLPEDGALIINGTIDNVGELTDGLACPVIRYGDDASCDYYPADIRYDEMGRGSYTLHHRLADGTEETAEVALGVVGRHNIYNSMAAIALADHLGIGREHTLAALRAFTGTDRRFEKKGEIGGITILDDYAHHPTEIRATLTAAQHYPHKKIWCVFQPHTYTRTKAFLDEFADALSLADAVILTDIYAAREQNTIGITSRDLLAKLEKKKCETHYFSYFDDIENYLLLHALPGDVIITMGAGDVVQIGEHLLGR
ncbi:MAG: UDP-N-acetylmuramate--L-alanine ligase [Lachnospiraceae bacterium]|nr:UDP-N-acetylmuramate--L-alanine ligase [Lachnospiraceae bacterium]